MGDASARDSANPEVELPRGEAIRCTAAGAEISTFVVQTTRGFTGRGPTRTRTFVSDALVTVVMEDVLSKGERSLVREGREDDVQRIRHAVHDVLKPVWSAAVEQIVGRPVVAFLSAQHAEPDITIVNFVLGRPAR
ncbi:hypothetical protein DSM112329_01896 [Paraconexibacter sp. AEG42_29]|uniref:Na+-translocating membrane potential-generating system MpsC domain-containing protein n=1 Tax=Paraconexibacter sp. AEG42_29 TaxID=2997339 RepID=A0AAU7ATM8_9ACTN